MHSISNVYDIEYYDRYRASDTRYRGAKDPDEDLIFWLRELETALKKGAACVEQVKRAVETCRPRIAAKAASK